MIYNYAGLSMQMAKTNELSFEAVYSSDGIDYLYTKVRIDIQFMINPKATAYTIIANAPVATPGTLPATTVAAIRHTLMQPRQQLVISDYLDQVMLQCPADGFVVDAKDGPKPLSCKVDGISGARTFVGRWVCECHIIECLADGNPPLIISNRWSDSHHINESQLTTRVASGRTVFRRDWLEQLGYPLDEYRDQFPLPDVAPGFQRIAVDIVENSAGNEAVWRVTDQERMYDLGETDPRKTTNGVRGSGILEIDGSQTLQSVPTGAGGPTCGTTVNSIILRAKGSRVANQWAMIERLVQLSFTMYDANGNNWITDGSMSRSLGQDEKWVELKLAIRQAPVVEAKEGMGNIDPEAMTADVYFLFGDKGGVNPSLLNDNDSRGSSTVWLITQGLTSSCETPTPPVSDGSAPSGPVAPQGPPPAVTVGTVDELNSIPSSYNTTSQSNTYTSYKVEARTETNPGTLQPGTTSSTGPAPIFQLHQPISRMTVAGYAECIGANPLLPRPQPTDPNYVLIHPWYITPAYPVVLNDAVTPVMRSDFLFTYAMLTPADPKNPVITIGQLPWTTIPSQTASLTPSDFDDSIMGI